MNGGNYRSRINNMLTLSLYHNEKQLTIVKLLFLFV